MSSSESGANGSVGFAGLLAIAFIVLKLCNVIDWSWWWVLSPLWIALGAVMAIIIVALLVAGIGCAIQHYVTKGRKP